MANTAHPQRQLIKRADPVTPQQEAIHNQAVASAAKNDALSALPPLLALGAGAGAVHSLWHNWRQRNKLEKLKKQVQFNPQPFPMYGKSASLAAKTANFLLGDNATSKWSVPLFLPAATAALYGGYQLGKGGVNAITGGNRKADAAAEAEAEKKKYLQALRGELPVPTGGYKSASGWFSMDTWGPALGVGTGVVGAASLANFLSKYHSEKDKARKAREANLRAGLEADVQQLRPKLETKAPVTAPFQF